MFLRATVCCSVSQCVVSARCSRSSRSAYESFYRYLPGIRCRAREMNRSRLAVLWVVVATAQPSPFVVRVGTPANARAPGAESVAAAGCTGMPVAPPRATDEWHTCCWCTRDEKVVTHVVIVYNNGTSRMLSSACSCLRVRQVKT